MATTKREREMSARQIFYERLTWPEIREAARADRVVIIPFASIEQHGPHLPVDVDLRLAREVCERAARRNPNCLVMTPMAFGFEPHHMAWPGTIDVDWDVLIRYGVGVVSSLCRHGFKRILIINGHGSNRPILEMIVRLAQVKHPEALIAGQSWFALGAVAKAFQAVQESEHTSHACELETAAYLAIDPDLVKMDEAVADYTFRRSPHFWADLTGKKPDPDSTVPLVAMEYFATGSATGVRGDPTKATAEKGELALTAAAEEVAQIVDEMRARRITPPPDHHEADVESLKHMAKRR
jgi:creatinine amidohydrolase